MNAQATKALDRATQRARDPSLAPPAPRVAATRAVAIGDPQASAARFFEVLAAHGLLGDDGRLAPDAGLVSMGDHFDIDVADRARGQADGVQILAWLAAHAPTQVTILFGNHDAARVMELATVDDARFAEAAAAGRAIDDLPRADRAPATAAFRARFPELATPGYAARDYNAFTVAQRALVQALLLRGRFALATTARVRGRRALLTHAGVTHDQLALLGGAPAPEALAAALDRRLADAVAAVADDWAAARPRALSLAPLHVAGADGQEGGGLLYHRPADPDRPGADPAWERGPRGARRFDPRRLPRGLAQVVGHTGHSKAAHELARWCGPEVDARPGGVRTLRVTPDDQVSYRRGVHLGDPGDAILVMVDPEMRRAPTAAAVELLELEPA